MICTALQIENYYIMVAILRHFSLKIYREYTYVANNIVQNQKEITI